MHYKTPAVRALLILNATVFVSACSTWRSAEPYTLAAYVVEESPTRVRVDLYSNERWVVWAPAVERDTLLGRFLKTGVPTDRRNSEVSIPLNDVRGYERRAFDPWSMAWVVVLALRTVF